ncbi:MAG: hypothetical protein A2W80_01970 [Candidatus Riflebacteria bacterium GWC2_50_8]|nr:MAG: hypothetical protein A2W80_01970 [Candidatus Riflebacteria bacterium GWC2_50_8]
MQIASDSNSGLVRGALAVTRAKLFSDEIEFATYVGTSNFLSSPNFVRTIATTVSPKSLSMMQSKAYLYFFWLDNDKIKTARKGSGKDFLPINTLTTPELDNSIGLAGCTIVTASNQEYIALTYAKSNNTVNITTFTDSSDTPAGSQAILLKDNLGNPTSIDTTKVAIAYNQRNQKVTLTWTSGGNGYFAIYNFTPPATFIEHVGPSLIGSGFETSYGISVESYANFESTLVLPETTLKSYSLREPATLSDHGSFGDPSYAIQFPFIDENNKHYAGLLGYAYSDYKFYRRELKFPDEGRWDKTSKVLHLEGPPWPNTEVKIEYEFTEVATSSCLANLANANGLMRPFNNQTGIIASSSDSLPFTIKFDADMYPASYPGYITNDKIRMFDNANNPVNISYLSGTATEISIRPVSDLAFSSNYRITIASDVIDARGTQIWEPITLNFTTQKTSSSVLASEVKDITVWRDSARTQLISPGAEASDTADIYLRLEALDPAFNTIDTATAVILLNGVQIAQATLTQINPTSNYFDGFYKLGGALATDSIYTFKAHADSATSTSIVVTYPTFSPISPLAGATNVVGQPTIRIKASESILESSVSTATVKLLRSGVEVAVNRSYTDGTKEISFTPTVTLESETTYTVTLEGLRDNLYNTQIGTLSYQFTIADIKPPEVTTYSPNAGETGVTIDRHIIVNCTEPLLASTVNKTNAKLTRAGVAASYSIILSGNQIRIDPDDAPDGGLRPQTAYTLEVTTAITDLAGNNLLAALNLSFTTQPYNTPPIGIDDITLYKDPLLIDGWGLYEKMPASATVYIKVTGDDGATQTRDMATATLSFSWGAADRKISLIETASNSTGIYLGSINLGSPPLFDFPAPLPPTIAGSLTFSVDIEPANAATLTVTFPALLPGTTVVNSTNGQVAAANATNVRIDSPITLAFSDQLLDGGNTVNLTVSSGAVNIAGTRTLSADQHKITFLPDSPLPYSSKITVNATYAANGLKSLQGNPLYSAVNFAFDTQEAQTQPVTVAQLNLFNSSDYSPTAAYQSNDDFIRSGNMYVEVRGTDASPNTADFTMVSISTGGSLRLDETAANSGVYRGIYSYSNLADGLVFIASSTVNPLASQTLILSIPSLTPQIPASSSINVSIYTNIEVKVSEAADPATVNSGNVKLFKAGVEVAGAVSYRETEREIVFTPAVALATSTLYIYRISNIKDLAGNSINNDLIVSFTTQGSTVPLDQPIIHLKVFSDSTYLTELADLASITPGIQVYVEIKGNDLSAGTIDATLVEQRSTLSAGAVLTTLIETGPNTGIFHGTLTVFNEEGAQITITSDTDDAKFVRLKTYTRPTVSLSPASGTATVVYLNQTFTLSTSKDVDPATLSSSSIRLSDSSGIASFSLSLPNPREIKIVSELQPDSLIVLRITDGLKDADGLPFPETVANYASINPIVTSFGVFADTAHTSPLNNGSSVESGQTVYLRLDRSDAMLDVVEYATATLNSSLPASSILLTESSPGRFTGSFVTPALPDETIELVPENRADLARTLLVLPAFSLLSYSPASGAITVPADVWPTWNFSRPVRNSDITTANFALKKASDNSTVPGTLSISPTGKQVRFQPAGQLLLLTEFEMSVAATIQDTSGNTLGEGLATRFTTQPPPPPPKDNITMANYESADYATKTSTVAYDGTLYLELVAKDTSFSTYETARVRVDSSDGSLDGLELTLVEISQPSGIFRLAVPINLAPGVSITVTSQGDATLNITVVARARTTLQSIVPASGSIDLALDNPIRLNFSHSIDRNTVADGISLLASDARPIDLLFSYADADRSVLITPATSYASSTRHQLNISTSLRDSNGLFLLPESAWLTMRGESSATFDLLTGIAPRNGQSVALLGEATPGQLVLVATCTNMFETYTETRNLRIQTASATTLSILSELAPGSFRGEYSLPEGIVGDITATLLFAGQPAQTFQIAPLPTVSAIIPASGSSGIAELPAILATFSRKLTHESTVDALRIITEQGNIITELTSPAADNNTFSWRPLSPLPLQSTCTLQLQGLTDYLGQSAALYQHQFITGGRQGINLFSDNGFAQLIASEQVEIPVIFVEVAASGTLNLSGREFDLYARTGTQASTTVKLRLEPFSSESGRYRCSLELAPGKAVPQYPLSLLPGEWLELTSPILTNDRKLVYYLQSGSVSPLNILGIRLYSEKHFVQRVTDTVANPSLYIEVEAEDRNWFTTDTTKLKIYSEADPTGMLLDLTENGTHSSQFRSFIRLSRENTDLATQNLKVLPGQRIYLESAADAVVKTSIIYLPENNIKMMAVYPSPARGNSVNFRFYLNFPTYVDLKIYDTAGHEIYATGIRGQEGENVYEWRIPRKTANGTYFYAVRIDNESGFPDAKRRVRGKFAILR